MTPNDFQFASTLFDNRQRLIAAGKLQRWDVVKWTVTVNIGLAAAAIAFKRQAIAGMQLFWLAVIVAIIGWVLVLYYNWRLKRIRDESFVTENYLSGNGIDYSAISGGPPTSWRYDWQELIVFTCILLISIVPMFAAWKFVH